MKRSSLVAAVIIVILLISSCAGAPDIGDSPPDWFETPPTSTGEVRVFRGYGEAAGLNAAREASYVDLVDGIIEEMDLDSSLEGDPDSRRRIETLREKLIQAAQYDKLDGFEPVEGFRITRKDVWQNEDGTYGQAVEAEWERTAFDAARLSILAASGAGLGDLKSQEGRALEAETEENYYESAILWARAAGMALSAGDENRASRNLGEVYKVLQSLDYALVSAPETITVGAIPASPVVFRVTAAGSPVGNAPFAVGFPRLTRDGREDRGRATVSSDGDGLIQFQPPLSERPGIQSVTVAPSARPFLDLIGPAAVIDEVTASIEEPRAEARYEALSRTREIPTGILILETDMAGNPLESQAAARGIFENLTEEGYDISVMPLDPLEMIPRNDKELLRDIKAASDLFDRPYERVIYGTIRLDGFEQTDTGFNVEATGILYLADIDRQVVLFDMNLSKGSRASDGQQAITTAFRQLGRDFAQMVVEEAP